MTPHEFIAKWRDNELKERSASQSHFNDLCTLLGLADPTTADPKGEWFTFEKGVEKTTGGDGWADVWRKDHFAWEYKGRHANLDKALQQLLRYSRNLDNPPLLIVSDMDRIRVHTNFTNSVAEMHEFVLEDLRDGNTRERLKSAFTDPEAFKPAKTRQMLTEEVAREFATLAQRLRDRGHEAQAVAHFVVRCAFCMFAEDVDLLPNHMFTRLIEESRRNPDDFAELAGNLFGLMNKGGRLGLERVAWFNGGLFEDDAVLPLNRIDVDLLHQACKQDWSDIDPSILGTLFERGLDPGKRSQLGAHYTDRAKIDLIVGPVIGDPLTAKWNALREQVTTAVEAAEAAAADLVARAPTGADLKDEVHELKSAINRNTASPRFDIELPRQKRVKELAAVGGEIDAATARVRAAREEVRTVRDAFMAKLRAFRVLDPACGSGNFLYVALKLLKDIEHKVNVDAEALGVPLVAPEVGPANVLGIELNPFAAELARTSVWIGDIQWMRKNGFEPSRDPVLRPLETIECRDAVLADDGTRAEWPEADVVVGNPPFLGGKRMRDGLGEAYVSQLRRAYAGSLPGFSDLVTFWFEKARRAIIEQTLTRCGLVATNSISGGTNLPVMRAIATDCRIFNAWRDEAWTVDGAAVRVALVCFERREGDLSPRLNGNPVKRINPDLTGKALDLTTVGPLTSNANVAFIGVQKSGAFDVSGETARSWLKAPLNPNGKHNATILQHYVNGAEITGRPQDRWIVNFGSDTDEASAALFERPFEHALFSIQPVRKRNAQADAREFWWRYWRPRPELRSASATLS